MWIWINMSHSPKQTLQFTLFCCFKIWSWANTPWKLLWENEIDEKDWSFNCSDAVMAAVLPWLSSDLVFEYRSSAPHTGWWWNCTQGSSGSSDSAPWGTQLSDNCVLIAPSHQGFSELSWPEIQCWLKDRQCCVLIVFTEKLWQVQKLFKG